MSQGFVLVHHYYLNWLESMENPLFYFSNGKTIRLLREKLSSKTFEVFFVLNMLSPLAPADALIMITGLSRMSYRQFLIIILICRPISIITFSYFWIYGGEVIRRLLMTS